MTFRTFILSAFSVACLGVSILAYKSEERREVVLEMANAAVPGDQGCMTQGFETEQGWVGCLQPASFVLDEEPPSRLEFFIDEVAYVLGL